MKEKDRNGRVVDPFSLFEQKAVKEIDGMGQFWQATKPYRRKKAIVSLNTSNNLDFVTPDIMASNFGKRRKIDLIITSPPYCNAVDYHTRNKLEAYWLGLVQHQNEYLTYYPKYVGRRRVPKSLDRNSFELPELNEILSKVAATHKEQSLALATYFWDMKSIIAKIHKVLSSKGTFLLYIGDSQSAGLTVHTHEFLKFFACEYFDLVTEFSYNVPNRFMSYERHNGANIKVEWCMVFKKRKL